MDTLVIVGVGLLGGSIGLAARRRNVARRIVGVDPSPAALRAAIEFGAIDDATNLQDAVRAADLVVFCTPVDQIAAQVMAAAEACRPGVVLTDVGSTKVGILASLRGRLPEGVVFIGSHPLAGSEKSGPEHARADLFEQRLVIVTPEADSPASALKRVNSFWQSLGAKVTSLSAEIHDRTLALTSHLPHLVASALAGMLSDEQVPYTATGFRDTTRLAAANPHLWSGIFDANREPLLVALDRLIAHLFEFREAINASDRAAIQAMLKEGKRIRDIL